jgi:hypothetical protein
LWYKKTCWFLNILSTPSPNAEILEFIISKLWARIESKAQTFLVKTKAHRGEPLHERADDLADEGRTLEKAGESYQWKDRTTWLVYSYYDRAAHQWKKNTWSKTIRNAATVSHSLLHFPPEKWETVASGLWMQRAAWNRMVTRPVREHRRRLL